MGCSVCGSDKKLITHYLSYEPEITTLVCWRCHQIMHKLARMPQKKIIIDWVKQYGHLWQNGNEKCRKSGHRKNYLKEYAKTDKYKNQQKEYYFKNLTPEKMEKQIKLMEKINARLGDDTNQCINTLKS